jgi:hypothetical protein
LGAVVGEVDEDLGLAFGDGLAQAPGADGFEALAFGVALAGAGEPEVAAEARAELLEVDAGGV